MGKKYTEGDKLPVRRFRGGNQKSISYGTRVVRRDSKRRFYIIYNKRKRFISRVIDGVAYVYR